MVSLRSKRVIVGLAAAAVLATGGGVAYAEMQGGNGGSQLEARRQAFVDDVAAHLGVAPADLTQAFKTAALQRLDAAVAAGRLTQGQADVIRTRIESGAGPLRLRRPGYGLFARGVHPAADYLGIEPQQIASELRSGKSLAEIAREHGKTAAGLEQALLSAAQDRLDTAVQNGRLSQSEADQLLAGLKDIVPVVVDHAPAARSAPVQ